MANLAEKGSKQAAIALVIFRDAAAAAVFFLGLLFQGQENPDKEVPHNLVSITLKSLQRTVDREFAFWYVMSDGDIDFGVVHWATPRCVAAIIMEGCSPFFLAVKCHHVAFRQAPTFNNKGTFLRLCDE